MVRRAPVDLAWGRADRAWNAGAMRRILLYLGGVVLVVLAAFIAYLAFFDIPAQPTKVEKVLPDERFPH
jgi:hypothetical protein